jgi:hypothetical protein
MAWLTLTREITPVREVEKGMRWEEGLAGPSGDPAGIQLDPATSRYLGHDPALTVIAERPFVSLVINRTKL